LAPETAMMNLQRTTFHAVGRHEPRWISVYSIREKNEFLNLGQQTEAIR
jgi:hypothetical protein